MMAGNPNWWNMHPPSSTTSLFPPHVLANNGSSSVIPLNYLPDHHHHHHHHHHVQDPPPQSWSQLLLSGNNTTGLSEDDTEDRFGQNQIQHKKLENWEDHHQMISSTRTNNLPPRLPLHSIVDHHDHHDHNHVKQETTMDISYQKSSNNLLYGQAEHEIEILNRPNICANNWSQVILPAAAAAAVSSSSISRSCITSTSLGSTTADNINILDFSCNKPDIHNLARNQTTDHTTSSECNSTATGGALSKKARVQSSSQPPLKVRKERLGDRITALHQLVSPFGKTDTASVLLEAIGYIRFLQSQIEALSSPYLGHASKNMRNQTYDMERQEKQKDLRSRGLCLVPVSCTQHVGSDNGADYWAPANYSSGF